MKATITSYLNNITIEESSLKVSVQSFSYSVLSVTDSVIVEKVAGSTIGSHKIVKLGSDGLLYYASCDNLSDVDKIVGLSLNSANYGEAVKVLVFGRISDTSFNFDTEKPIFLGINGQIVQETPQSALFIQRIGKVLRSEEIIIDLDEPIIL